MIVPTITFDADASSEYPTVSVVVPIYNGAQDVPQLLQQLLNQTYPHEKVEFLLVDNGSQDNTFPLLQTATRQDSRLRPLSFSAIQSSYAARNVGIQTARGEVLVFTDADCRPKPNWLTALVQPFQGATVGLIAGEIAALPSANWLERYADRQDTLSQRNTLNHSYLPYGQTANLAVRASIFNQVGLFRPHLTTGGDADLCWRILQQTGWHIVHAKDALVYHRHRSTLAELRQQWYRYGCSNRYLHDLHGVELMRPLTPREIRYRLLRWLGKEVPQTTLKLLTGRAARVDLITTPLDLWCFHARTLGQQQGRLPEAAYLIESMGGGEGGVSEQGVRSKE